MGCSASRDLAHSASISPKESAQDAGVSGAKKKEALQLSEALFEATKGKRFNENYSRLTLTSYGASCKVLTAYSRATNQKVAVKTIPKSHKHPEKQKPKVLAEIGNFRTVEDHPNAVRLLEVYEGAECYYIVMECCDGGELFDHISKKKGGFTERQAAQILRSLMLFIAHMHAKGLVHMDIKPENIMFDSEGANGVLKVIDFGSSVFAQPHELVKNAFGTVRYSSPEMANDICGPKTDIWSAGVVMFILLCGRAPFLKNTDQDTLQMIKAKPKVKFTGERWQQISQAAKDCIKAMLNPDPDHRPTAAQVLQMPWLKAQVPDTAIRSEILQHLRTFANQSRIRRLLLGLMADQLVGGEANKLLDQFYTMDQDFSGTLEIQELIKAAQKAIPELTEAEIIRMFHALDVDQTGTVDVKEFFAGLLQTMDQDKQNAVAAKSFSALDKRGSGFVTKEAFMQVLFERVNTGPLNRGNSSSRRNSNLVPGNSDVLIDPQLVQELEQEFAFLDANGDGVLSFEEFKAILGITSGPEGLLITSQMTNAVMPENFGQIADAIQRVQTSTSEFADYESAEPKKGTREILELLNPARTSTHRTTNNGSHLANQELGTRRSLSANPLILGDAPAHSRAASTSRSETHQAYTTLLAAATSGTGHAVFSASGHAPHAQHDSSAPERRTDPGSPRGGPLSPRDKQNLLTMDMGKYLDHKRGHASDEDGKPLPRMPSGKYLAPPVAVTHA